jgi:hypothetical protein
MGVFEEKEEIEVFDDRPVSMTSTILVDDDDDPQIKIYSQVGPARKGSSAEVCLDGRMPPEGFTLRRAMPPPTKKYFDNSPSSLPRQTSASDCPIRFRTLSSIFRPP